MSDFIDFSTLSLEEQTLIATERSKQTQKQEKDSLARAMALSLADSVDQNDQDIAFQKAVYESLRTFHEMKKRAVKSEILEVSDNVKLAEIRKALHAIGRYAETVFTKPSAMDEDAEERAFLEAQQNLVLVNRSLFDSYKKKGVIRPPPEAESSSSVTVPQKAVKGMLMSEVVLPPPRIINVSMEPRISIDISTLPPPPQRTVAAASTSAPSTTSAPQRTAVAASTSAPSTTLPPQRTVKLPPSMPEMIVRPPVLSTPVSAPPATVSTAAVPATGDGKFLTNGQLNALFTPIVELLFTDYWETLPDIGSILKDCTSRFDLQSRMYDFFDKEGRRIPSEIQSVISTMITKFDLKKTY